jgi:hypothetical protein
MTVGNKERLRLEAGATTREDPLDLNTEASTTAFVFTQHVHLLIIEQAYTWLSAWEDKELLVEDALTRGGLRFDTTGLEDGGPLARTAAKYEALLDTSLSPIEASEMLGVSVDDVIQRLADGTLYGVLTRQGWRIPDFQFEGGRSLPGIEEVLPLLHEELHPLAVHNWLANPNPDLLVGNNVVSPRQWLLGGRDVAAVARLAIDV